MPINATPFIWFNGKMVPWEKATVHVLSHALHYGSSVFEGERAYVTHRGVAIFRLKEHTRRLFDSAKIHRMVIPFTPDEIDAASRDIIAVNNLRKGAYIRPIALRGYGEIGVSPKNPPPVEVAIAAWEWGAYLGAEALEQGVDACVSSWRRLAPDTIPTLAKAGGNYLSSSLIGGEAQRLGFAEGIGLAIDGTVSEGAGENLFLVKDGVLLTAPLAYSVLGGITRDTVMRLAKDLKIEIREQAIPREMLYLADEAFFTGTAVEITPVRSVDRIDVGNGRRGPITAAIQKAFFGIFDGSTADRWGWLDHIDFAAPRSVAAG
jgi:branched-chain amino acid aminotransferase